MEGKGKGVLVLAAVSVAAAAFLVYLPSLGNGFVNWDDNQYVYENPNIRTLGPGFLRWALTSVVASNWHPLTMFTLALDYSLWGLNPKGYHLTNAVLHALNTALVFAIGVMVAGKEGVFRKAVVGAAAALLFGLHPIHVESVAWVSERKDVLSAFFYLSAIVVYLRYARGLSLKHYFLALFIFLLALLSKPMAVSLPLVLLVLDFYPLERLGAGRARKAFLEKIPFFALGIISVLITLWAQRIGEAIKTLEAFSLTERVAGAFRAYIFYIYKMILPLDLAPFYPWPRDAFFSSPWFFISLLLFLAVTGFCVLRAGRKKWYLAVWLYYVVTLLPVIGIIQVGEQGAADRYMYLPSVGPFILAASGLGHGLERFARLRLPLVLATAFFLGFLVQGTIRQERVWLDSLTLWSHEIGVYPEGTYLAYHNRGLTYQLQGESARAIKDYDKAIELNPRHAPSYTNRGVIYGQTGRLELATRDLERAIELDPGDAPTYYNLGLVYARLGDTAKAEENFKKARELGFR